MTKQTRLEKSITMAGLFAKARKVPYCVADDKVNPDLYTIIPVAIWPLCDWAGQIHYITEH